jgi:DNA-binding FadR family transcriptional regulator
MRNLRRRGLHDRIVAEIGQRIICGEFSVGEPLPSESVLYTSLGISRTALREALRVLSAKGLVEARPKRGTLVRPTEDWNFLDAEILTWRLNSQGESERAVDELYELRHLIEPVAASLAATHATSRDVKTMREAYHDMAAAGDDGVRVRDPDVRFHRAIIRASGNALFSSLANVLNAALTVNFDLVRNAPAGHIHSLPDHKKVLDAIVAHDAPAARLAMQRLIDESQRQARLIRRRRVRAPRPAASIVRTRRPPSAAP